MTEDLRKRVYQTLLGRSNDGILHKKDTAYVAAQFDLHIRTVQRVWNQGKTQLKNSIPVVVDSLKKGRVGRKAIPVDLEALRNIPLKERMTIEDVCAKLNLSKWRIQRYLKKGLIRRHSSSIKPYLTQANKTSRLKWCVDMIKRDFLADPRFKDLYDFVFIDEKWFFLYQKSEKYYLLPDEEDAYRTCKNKNYNLSNAYRCFGVILYRQQVLVMLDEKLAVQLDEADHGVDYVIRVDETTARAWPEPRMRMVPCLAVLMDEMTASANKSDRRQRMLRLRRHGVRHELEGLRHHLRVQRGGVVLGRHLRLRRDGVL